jgi:hypothetical protein
VPEDAIYRLNLGDEMGRPLDGASKYVMHFEKEALSPVRAFRSITLYDFDGFQVENSLSPFAVSSWMPLNYNGGGSLDLYFQSEGPGKEKEANCLPAPERAVQSDDAAIQPESGGADQKNWSEPPVTKGSVLPGLESQ